MGDSLESENCSICYDSILSQPTAALGCGHVYHRQCIESWLAQCSTRDSKTCPQCKVRTRESQVRPLLYEVVPALMENPVEVQRDMAADPQVRRNRLKDLHQELRDARAEKRRLEAQTQEATDEANADRDERKRLQEVLRELQQRGEELKIEQNDATTKWNQVLQHYDERIAQTFSRLPFDDPRDNDADLLEEKRKLKHMDPGERALSLHKELVSSVTQKSDAHKVKVDRLAHAIGKEQECEGLRLECEGLRLEVEQLRLRMAQAATTAQAPRADTSAPSIRDLKRDYRTAPKVPNTAQIKRARSQDQAPVDSDDDLLDFAGPTKLRRASSAGFGLALRGVQAAPAPKLATTVPLRRVKSQSLKALFAQRA